jgi:hypothetical protein
MASLPATKWDYDSPPLTPLIAKIGVLTMDLHDGLLPGAEVGVMRFFSLYLYILCHLAARKPEETIRRSITDHGRPIFDSTQFAEVARAIKAQFGTDFAKQLLAMSGCGSMVGGGEKTAAPAPKNASATNAAAAASGAKIPNNTAAAADDDPSRSKFWDVFIRTRLYNLTKGLPPAFDSFAPIIFALYSLEQIEVLGPLIATGLDSITLGLPILGKLLGTTFSKIVALAPIPYAGPVGDIVAYLIALVFIMISVNISVSRKQFGTAFLVGIEAIPVFGGTIASAALLFEKQVERYEFNKKKVLDSLQKVSPHLSEALGSLLPDLKNTGKPKEYIAVDWDTVMAEAIMKAIAEQGEMTTAKLIDPKELSPKSKALFKDPEARKQLGLDPLNAKRGGRRKTRRLRR